MARDKFTIELGAGFVSKSDRIDVRLINGLLAAIDKNLRVPKKYGVQMNPSFRKLALRSRAELEAETPKSEGGGKLAKSWKVVVRTSKAGIDMTVENRDPRADLLLPIFEYGAKPHRIRPRNKKALAFFWEKAGKDVVFREVNHPGIKGTRLVERARRRLRRRTNIALSRLVDRWIKNVGL